MEEHDHGGHGGHVQARNLLAHSGTEREGDGHEHGHSHDGEAPTTQEGRLVGRKMSRQERELYKQAVEKQGKLWKRSTNTMLGYQIRYFKIIANGRYLVYYEKAQNIENLIEFRKDLKPNGVMDIGQLENIAKVGATGFEFTFITRVFQFKAETEFDAENWVTCLRFLAKLRQKAVFHPP